MKSFDYKITDEVGIHARPAGQLAKAVKELGVKVTITKDDKTVEAQKLMAVMGLGVKKDDVVTVAVDGDDAAFDAVKKFFEENL